MPFDATQFGREPMPPPPPRRNSGAAWLVIVVSVLLLVTPFSLAACSDLVHYARSR